MKYRPRAGDPLMTLLDAEALAELRFYAETAPAGSFLQLGVYRGGSAMELYRIASRTGRTLYLYDTFRGHPAPGPNDNAHAHPKGRYSDCIAVDILQERMPHAVILAGEFPATFVPPDAPIAFAHIDCDLYEPTLAACTLLRSHMADGGVMLFDDYGHDDECPGATQAVDEVFGKPIRRVVRLTGSGPL